MIEQLKTIRDNLGKFAAGYIDAGNKIVDALAQLEAMAGEHEPVAWVHPTQGHMQRRTETMSPEVVASYERGGWTPLYTAAPVAQQPQEPDWKHPKIQALIGADARNRIVIDLIWRILKEPEGGWASAMDMEYWDSIHDAVQAAVMKAQQPQAEAVPPGYVRVPVEPTDEMIDAACEAVKDLYWVDFVRAYKAAIAQQKGGV